MVIEPASFHRQPDALYGVETGRIRRQLDLLEFLQKRFAQLLILFVRPWLRRL
jgi:hypothetical protein